MENGAGSKNDRPGRIGLLRENNITARDVHRHQVWGALHPPQIQTSRDGHGPDQCGFSQTGCRLQQSVATGQQCEHEFGDGRGITNNVTLHFGTPKRQQPLLGTTHASPPCCFFRLASSNRCMAADRSVVFGSGGGDDGAFGAAGGGASASST